MIIKINRDKLIPLRTKKLFSYKAKLDQSFAIKIATLETKMNTKIEFGTLELPFHSIPFTLRFSEDRFVFHFRSVNKVSYTVKDSNTLKQLNTDTAIIDVKIQKRFNTQELLKTSQNQILVNADFQIINFGILINPKKVNKTFDIFSVSKLSFNIKNQLYCFFKDSLSFDITDVLTCVPKKNLTI